MSSQLGTQGNPLRVAIIGSGPSGFYAAEALQRQENIVVEIDMYDRLPTPYGLVRGGVAPDHPKIKTVTKVYEKTASHPNFRFYGNVDIGTDITHDDLMRHYHQIIYAVGAQTDRRMDIPGEDLPGSYPATEFVGWYNAHPDFRDLTFDLTQTSAAVIGNGNVAMDVARILASTYEELAKTDIADYALEALKHSRVRDIYMIGRRGPAQAAFTSPELRELGELTDAQVIVPPQDAELDLLSAAELAKSADRTADRNVQTLQRYSLASDVGKPRKIHMRFLASPVEILGENHVEAIKLVKNELYTADDGTLRPRPTNVTEVLNVGLVFRSIGYKGVALPGIPFDERKGVIPNAEGRVMDTASKQTLVGEYVVGWIKRGPSGIIGTNKPDSQATVIHMLEDIAAGQTLNPAEPERESIERLLAERKPSYVTFQDWMLLDKSEQEAGAALARPRLKVSRVDDMLRVIAERKGVANPAGD
jgi:ferredoxin/flavodoxin---NADP+ reductase